MEVIYPDYKNNIIFVFMVLLEVLWAQTVKRLSAMQETWVRSLGWKDPSRRKWQPTLVFLPGKSHGPWSLVGYRPWGRKEWGTTEQLHFHFEVLLFRAITTTNDKSSLGLLRLLQPV